MNKLKYLKKIYELLKTPNPESLALSMKDVHHRGLFSLVIGGNEFGKLLRVFIADEELPPYAVQLHSHRYPITLTAIKGDIKHYVAHRTQIVDSYTVQLSEFKYRSPLNGGNGLEYLKETDVILRDYSLPIGASLEMTENDIHSVSCSEGSIWIVQEQGFVLDESIVLGVPFTVDMLYNQPLPFQINDKHQLVKKEIKKLILDYEFVD